MHKIAVVSFKGGTGKTGSTINLASALSKKYKVHVIDMDAQANLTSGLGIDKHSLKKTISSVLKDDVPAEECIIIAHGIDIIPANIELINTDRFLASSMGKLRTKLKRLSEYDFVIFDTAPNLSNLTVNVLVAAEYVVIPVEASPFALDGLQILDNEWEDILGMNPNIQLIGSFMTKYDKRENISKDSYRELEKKFGDKTFKTKIRVSAEMKKSQKEGKPLIDFSQSNASEDYIKLADELVGRLK